MSKPRHLLILPRLRVQNANAISSPLTWGFPAMSAFVGFMHALERKLPDDLYLQLEQIGVVCHSHEILSSSAGYNLQQFHLTRNPVNKDGDTAAIAEEGRMHMDISLVFAVSGDNCRADKGRTAHIAEGIDDIVHGMRIAGGSVIPRNDTKRHPQLVSMPDDADEYEAMFRKHRSRLLPGFALVLNEQALTDRLDALQTTAPGASRLDAWLDFARLHHQCVIDADDGAHRWEVRSTPGWHVPIPIGYGTLSTHEPGEVANARDATTPFRFVESLYSIGQWVSPHRLDRPESLLWYVDNDLEHGVYRLNNDYRDHKHS
ncbi:CRISPR-associated protein Csy2 [Salinisphaera orenii MK-B5]|uniref:CRISPR-associated protein Csy2 n=1 Tax=Salinisphaera orenii MK-B5 TaxID=856730 RepID=A0A423PIH7_9GAMM|nr:type I-F CRISPR-associated protein Csy2 [Salinisphaera orenii]ROO25400.1 CRISPR-associated protein Csy2 [Salinisphaera orenii MK-B5]